MIMSFAGGEKRRVVLVRREVICIFWKEGLGVRKEWFSLSIKSAERLRLVGKEYCRFKVLKRNI